MKIVSSLLLLSFGIGALIAQDDTYNISESFTVSAATVEVVVTDAKGVRITNLPSSAFSLTVDKAPQQVTFFSEIRDANESGAEASAEEAAHVIENSEVSRNYLVFIDDWFTQRPYRAKLFRRLLSNVDAMRPIDRMAVVRYKGKGLELLSPWTSDPGILRQVIKEAAQATPGEQVRLAKLNHGVIERGREIATVNSREREILNRQNDRTMTGMATELERQISVTTSAVEVAMRSMALVDGRKMLLLVSSGWPYNFQKLNSMEGVISGMRNGGVELLRPVTDTANLLGFTIYPMLLGQVESGPEAADFSAMSDFEVNHDSMAFLAERTGGQLINKAQFRDLPLTDVAKDQQGYYTLGFVTSDLKLGERHNIQVTLNGYDYKVRHRQDFRGTTPKEQADVIAQAALLTGITPDDLEVTLGTPKKQKHGQILVPISVNIPLDWVSLEREGDLYKASLTLRVAAEDKNGYQSDMVRAPIDMKGGKPANGQVSVYDASILISNKKQRLMFTLQDELAGVSKVTTVEFIP